MTVLEFKPNGLSNWLIGAPTKVRESSGWNGMAMEHRTTGYAYNDGTFALEKVEREPDDPGIAAYHLTTTISRGSDGQVTSVNASDNAGNSRGGSFTYDPIEGIYRQTSTNSRGLTTTTVYHPAVDQVALSRDPNGLVTRLTYDGFGRLRRGDMPGGAAGVSIDYVPGDGVTSVESTVDGSGKTTVQYDRLARPVLSTRVHAGGVETSTILYDAVGRPREVNEGSIRAELEHDELGRLTKVTGPLEVPPGNAPQRGLLPRVHLQGADHDLARAARQFDLDNAGHRKGRQR